VVVVVELEVQVGLGGLGEWVGSLVFSDLALQLHLLQSVLSRHRELTTHEGLFSIELLDLSTLELAWGWGLGLGGLFNGRLVLILIDQVIVSREDLLLELLIPHGGSLLDLI